MDALTDSPQPELDALAADMAKSVSERIEHDIIGLFHSLANTSCTGYSASIPLEAPFDISLPEPAIEVYKPEPRRFFSPWYDHVVVNAPIGLAILTACDSGDSPDEPTTYLSTLPARSRAKAVRAIRNCRRALARHDMRRARHWLRIAEAWVGRKISGIGPNPAKSAQTPPV